MNCHEITAEFGPASAFSLLTWEMFGEMEPGDGASRKGVVLPDALG